MMVALTTLAGCLTPDDPVGPANEDEFCAVTPGGWGAPPSGNNPGALLHANFDAVFGADLTVGPNVFEDAQEVTDTIPNDGDSSADPLLNHAVALAINIAFGDAGLLDGSVAGQTVTSGPFAGKTAVELLAIAETALADADRTTAEYSDLIDALTGFNEGAFGCGEPCPPGMDRDEAGECVSPPPPCPDGQVRNDMGECVTPPPPPCPDGQTRNDMGECVTTPPPPCPDGKVRNANGRCVTPPPEPCPDGMVRDGDGDCVTPPPPPCPDGEMRGDDGDCAPIPCPDGMTRDGDGDCVPPPPPPCPDGMERDGSGNCVAPPDGEEPCPDGEMRGDDGECAPVPPPAECPEVTARATSDRSIWLEWEAGAAITIVRSGESTPLATGDGTAGSFRDTGREVGVVYSYTVMLADGTVCEVIQVAAIPEFGSFVGVALAVVGGLAAYVVLRRR